MAPRSADARSFDPETLLAAWHRRKGIAVAVFVAALAAAVTVSLSLPPLYQATATVLVERQEVSEAFVRPSVTAELETRIQTIDQRVRSRARLEALIARLGLYPETRGKVPPEAVVERMDRDIQLHLKGVDQSGRAAIIAFTVGYIGRTPSTVAAVANTLAGLYVEENASSRTRQADQTVSFLKDQVAEAKADLDAREARTHEFTLLHIDELPQQMEANRSTLERLNAQLGLNEQAQLRAIERRERIEQDPADTRPSTRGQEWMTPAAYLASLKEKRAELRWQFKDQYPDLVRLNNEIAALERQLAESGGAGTPAVLSPADRARQAVRRIDDEIRGLKQEETRLRREIAAYQTRLESAPRWQQTQQQLSRGYESSKDRYQTLLKQYEDARTAATLEQGRNMEQFRVLDPAVTPRRPAAPNRAALVGMGFVAALALAVLVVALVERLDTTFTAPEDVQALADLPILAAIGELSTAAAARARRHRLALAGVSLIVGVAILVVGSYRVASGNEQLVRLTARGRL
jgi:protein tyrosine kinase modulator